MQMAIDVAGFTPAEADQLRRAMGSKRVARSGWSAARDGSTTGMAGNGITGDAGRRHLRQDRGVRQLRLPREPRDQLRLPGLRQRLAQAATTRPRSAPRCSTPSRWASTRRSPWSTTPAGTASRCAGPTSTPCAAGPTLEPRPVPARPPAPRPAADWSDLAVAAGPAVRLGLAAVRTIGAELAERIAAAARRAVPGHGRPGPPGRPDRRAAGGAGHRGRVRLLRADPAGGAVGGRRGGPGPARPAARARRSAVDAPPLPGMTEVETLMADVWATGLPRTATRPSSSGTSWRPAGVRHRRSGLSTDGRRTAGAGRRRGHPPAAAGDRRRDHLPQPGGRDGMLNVICSKAVWARHRRVARAVRGAGDPRHAGARRRRHQRRRRAHRQARAARSGRPPGTSGERARPPPRRPRPPRSPPPPPGSAGRAPPGPRPAPRPLRCRGRARGRRCARRAAWEAAGDHGSAAVAAGRRAGAGRARAGLAVLLRRPDHDRARHRAAVRDGVPARARPADHQRGAGGVPDAVPLHDQRLPRLQPRLHVLLRPADPRLPRARTSARTSSAGIVVKVNAVERLRAELRSPDAGPASSIAMGTNTDPYQRCEGKYRLTRGIVEVLAEAREPVLDPDQVDAGPARPRPAGRGGPSAPTCRVNLSIGTLDEEVWRATEPGTPHPRRRVDAVAQLTTPASGLRRAGRAGAARAVRRAGAAGRGRDRPASRPAPCR